MNRQKVDGVVAKIRYLQFVTRTTGFITNRTQGDLLKTLNTEELVLAGQLLQQERETDDRRPR
jgi:hypothetical protein